MKAGLGFIIVQLTRPAHEHPGANPIAERRHIAAAAATLPWTVAHNTLQNRQLHRAAAHVMHRHTTRMTPMHTVHATQQ